MELSQAFNILEIPETSSMSEIKRAYRDLIQIWHPDRYTHNERLHNKALEKMKELNAAYEYITFHFDSPKTKTSTNEEPEQESPLATIVICPECGVKNRVRLHIDRSIAKCGKCSCYLFPDEHVQNPENKSNAGPMCGDSACGGNINSSARCTRCGKTYEESISAEKERQEDIRQLPDTVKDKIRKLIKIIIYDTLGLGFFILLFLLIIVFLLSPSEDKSKLQTGSNPNWKPDKHKESAQVPINANPPPQQRRQEAPYELEPVNPNRLRTGSSPFSGGIRLGHSELTVENGTDTDAIVRAVRSGDGGRQKVRNFYVRANEQFLATEIPSGSYVLKVAFGMDWNQKTRKFNYRRSFAETQTFSVNESTWTESREDGDMERTRFSKLSITLHKVLHGNFKSHPISEEDFWQ